MAAICSTPCATTTSYPDYTTSYYLPTYTIVVDSVPTQVPQPIEKEEEKIVQPKPKIMKIDFPKPKHQTFMHVQRKHFTSFISMRPKRI